MCLHVHSLSLLQEQQKVRSLGVDESLETDCIMVHQISYLEIKEIYNPVNSAHPSLLSQRQALDAAAAQELPATAPTAPAAPAPAAVATAVPAESKE